MNTISPISDPDDIRKESEENKPVGPHPELASSDSQPTAAVSADGSMPDPLAVAPTLSSPVNTEAQPVVTPLPVNQPQALAQPSQSSPETPSQGASSIYPSVAQPSPLPLLDTSDIKTSYGFEYSLPLTSYLISLLSLVTFYSIVITPLITLTMLATSISSFSPAGAYVSSQFGFEIIKQYGPYIPFLLLSIFLVIPRRWSRWMAMLAAGGIVLYGIYSIFNLDKQSGGMVLENATKVDVRVYFYLFVISLPYIIAPLVTIPYLLTPKASRAYS